MLPLTVQLVSVTVPTVVDISAAAGPGGVAADRAVGQRGRAVEAMSTPPPAPPAELPLTVQSVSVSRAVRLNRPPPSTGVVAAEGAVGQRGRGAFVAQAAADVAGGVAADGAVGQRGRSTVSTAVFYAASDGRRQCCR